jgi:hypothetical protein
MANPVARQHSEESGLRPQLLKHTLLVATLFLFGQVHATVPSSPPQYYPIDRFNNGGYINRQGEVAIPRQFHYAGPFSEGLAFVMLDGRRCGYIDEQGKFAIGPQEDWNWGEDFKEGIALVSWDRGESFPGTLLHSYAYIDRNGKYISSLRFAIASSFHEGLARVLVDSFYGYIDRRGRLAIRPRFGEAGDFSEGLALVRDGKVRTGAFVLDRKPRSYIDRRGRKVLAEHESLFFRGSFKCGLAPFGKPGWNGKDGYIDRRGRVAVSARFKEAYEFSEGRGMILDSGKIGWVNSSGKVVIPPMYGSGERHRYREGLAAVRTDSGWGYIDTSGMMVIPVRFTYADDFTGGIARVAMGSVERPREAYIDRLGRYVWTSWAPGEEPKRPR